MRSVRTRVGAVVIAAISVVTGVGCEPRAHKLGPLPCNISALASPMTSPPRWPGGLIWNGSAFVTNTSRIRPRGSSTTVQGLVGPYGGVVTTSRSSTPTSPRLILPQPAPGKVVTRHFQRGGFSARRHGERRESLPGLSRFVLQNSIVLDQWCRTTPPTITSGIPNQTVPLVAGQTISATVTGAFS